MPATSQAQYRAMRAAADGDSTLGIPKRVGADFVAATPHPGALPKHSDLAADVDKKSRRRLPKGLRKRA